MSVIFSATYGVRLADLNHSIMKEFYSIWESMLQCEHMHTDSHSSSTDQHSDFQPGSLLVDFIPALQKLPDAFQPWKTLARSLRRRETSLHLALLQILQRSSEAGEAPDCFGKKLAEVGPVL